MQSSEQSSRTPFGQLLSELGTRDAVAAMTGTTAVTVRRWANGGRRPDRENLRRLTEAVNTRFGLDITVGTLDDVIDGRTSLERLRREAAVTAGDDAEVWEAEAERAACGAVEMTRGLGARVVPEEALEGYSRRLTRLAAQFVHRPATTWFRPLADLWGELSGVLDRGTHPRQTRDLYLLGGMAGVVLAHGCHVVGRSDQGMVLARGAETLAAAVGHPELQAWALGTRALILDSLERRSPVDAAPLDLVEQALALVGRSRGTGVVRLLTYRARFAAHRGAVAEAREAQAEARRARDAVGEGRGDLDALGGILTFGCAKQQALDAGVHHACGDYPAAERAADAAITAYTRGPAELRSRGDLAIAHLDRAAAQAACGRVDAAAASVRPVLELDGEDMIAPLAPAFRRVARHLGAPALRGGSAAQLRDEILDRAVFPALPAGTIPA